MPKDFVLPFELSLFINDIFGSVGGKPSRLLAVVAMLDARFGVATLAIHADVADMSFRPRSLKISISK